MKSNRLHEWKNERGAGAIVVGTDGSISLDTGYDDADGHSPEPERRIVVIHRRPR